MRIRFPTLFRRAGDHGLKAASPAPGLRATLVPVHGFLGSVLALLAIGVLSELEWLGPVDGLLYDAISSLPQASTPLATKVLLVESPARTAPSPEQWEALMKTCLDLGAAVIAFTDIRDEMSPRFFEQATESGRIVFGRPLMPDEDDAERWVAAPLPKAFPTGVAAPLAPPPLADHGIVRRQRLEVTLDGESQEVLEAALARRLGIQVPNTPTVRVNFSALDALPRVTAEQALAGVLIPELVQGRAVLVGRSADALTPAIATPIGVSISPLVLQGLALNTLLERDWIAVPGRAIRFGVLLALGTVLLFAYQALDLRLALMLSAVAGMAGIALAWAALTLLRLWPPWVEMGLLGLNVFFFVYRRKAVEESERLIRMVRDTNAKLQRRAIPSGFLDTADQWSLVTALVDQTLSVTRTIFLERVPGQHCAREVSALRCTLQDIKERRRDYERPPYTTAIEKGCVIPVQNYLKAIAERETQFLCPLVFAGEVQGFWGFGIDPEQHRPGGVFEQTVNDIGQQVAELLYERKLWQQRRARQEHTWSHHLRDGTSKASSELRQALGAIERRLVSFESVFRDSATAAILYDLFGRVLSVNQRMSELLSEAGLAPYELTAVDVAGAVTSMSARESRDALRNVVLERRPLTLLARLPNDSSDGFLLSVRTVQAPDAADGATPEVHPFQVEGVLIELIDVGPLTRLLQARGVLIERVNYKLRGDLQTLIAAVELLQHSAAAPSAEIVEILGAKAAASARFMEDLQQVFVRGADADFTVRVPVDSRPLLLDAVAALEARAVERQVRVSVQVPDLMGLVFATPQGLDEVFKALLGFLIEDAAAEGQVTVSAVESNRQVRFELANQGFGLPEHRLKEVLDGDAVLSEGTLQSLRRAARAIRAWQGRLHAYSRIGEGSRFQLELEAFP
ncbi:MAG: CHASE2 domain-containing protein [Gammaproteobacteria bacterium]